MVGRAGIGHGRMMASTGCPARNTRVEGRTELLTAVSMYQLEPSASGPDGAEYGASLSRNSMMAEGPEKSTVPDDAACAMSIVAQTAISPRRNVQASAASLDTN